MGRRLRARLVPRHEEQGAVHHRRAVEHGGHQDVVPRAIHERHVAHELHLFVLETRHLAIRRVRHRAAVRAVARRTRTRVVLALVDLGVGVPELDGDVALELVFEKARAGFLRIMVIRNGISDRTEYFGRVTIGTQFHECILACPDCRLG